MWLVACLLAWNLVPGVAAANVAGLLTERQTRDQCPVPITSGKLSASITDPWSQQPLCKTWRPRSATGSNLPTRTHCLFSQASFRNNHGLSLITTSEAASDLLSFGALDESDECEIQASSPPRDFAPGPVSDPSGVPAYEVQDLPGKGKGAIALRRIKKNEVFMLDYPAVLAAADFAGAGWTKTQERLVESALSQLPRDTRKRVLDLAKSDLVPDMPLGDIFATNTCTLTLAAGVSHLGLFVEVSRMNHACVPNAFYRFLPRKLTMEVFAFRDIEPGEEININYAPLGMPHKVRRHYLEANYGFTCSCSLCQAPRSERELSDQHRTRLGELRGSMKTAERQDDWGGAVRYASQALEELSGLEAEALTPLVFEYYEKLSKIHLRMGDLGMARAYGVKAFDGFSHLRGAESDRAQELQRFLRTLERKGLTSGQ